MSIVLRLKQLSVSMLKPSVMIPSLLSSMNMFSLGQRMFQRMFPIKVVMRPEAKMMLKPLMTHPLMTKLMRYRGFIRPTLASLLSREAAINKSYYSEMDVGKAGKSGFLLDLKAGARKASLVSEIRTASSKTCPNFFSSPSSNPSSLQDLVLGKVIAKGCNAAVLEAHKDCNKLALKLMFNYGIESNEHSILNSMYREALPAQHIFIENEEVTPQKLVLDEFPSIRLSPHPNVVEMNSVFVDQIPYIKEARSLFPLAMPPRLIEDGLGGNASLFLVMKRYDCNVRTFLKECEELEWTTSLFMLTQLLEGVTHMRSHGVSHRDLKSDNLLLDLSCGPTHPRLVIADFGCSLINKDLKLAYSSEYVDLGGNAALMAPEVSTAKPGFLSYIDYSKADVYAAGAIAHELFKLPNPLYSDSSELYTSTPKGPALLATLINLGLMEYESAKRLKASVAANVCQLMLWAPPSWPLKKWVVNDEQLLQWLVMLSSKLVLETPHHRRDVRAAELSLIRSFLNRAKLEDIQQALAWMQKAI